MRYVKFVAILLVLIPSLARTQDLVIGEEGKLYIYLSQSYHENDSVQFYFNNAPLRGDVFSITPDISVNDELGKFIECTFTVPYHEQFLGNMNILVFRDGDQIGASGSVKVIAPAAEVSSVTNLDIALRTEQPKDVVKFKPSEKSVEILIHGKHLFPEPTNPFVINDEKITIEYSGIHKTGEPGILLKLSWEEDVQPGLKTLYVKNFGGITTKVEFRMYALNKPEFLKQDDNLQSVVLGESRRILLKVKNPDQVGDIFLSSDSEGKKPLEGALFRIDNEHINVEEEKLPVFIIIGNASYQDAWFVIRSKNDESDICSSIRLSSVLKLKQEGVLFKLVNDMFEGDMLTHLSFDESSQGKVMLNPNEQYVIVSPANEKYILSFDNDSRSLVFNDPVSLTKVHQGRWTIAKSRRNPEISGHINVKRVPVVKNVNWYLWDERKQSWYFSEKLYATGDVQRIRMDVDIDPEDVYAGKELIHDFLFFDNNAAVVDTSVVLNRINGKIVRLSAELLLSADVSSNYPYNFVFKPANTPLYKISLLPYNRPVKRSEAPELMKITFDRHLESVNMSDFRPTVFVDHYMDFSYLSLDFNRNVQGAGPQFFKLTAILYDDMGKEIGEKVIKRISPLSTTVSIAFYESQGFREPIRIEPWYSVYIKVEHDFSQYQPAVKEEDKLNTDEYVWEKMVVFKGGNDKIGKWHAITPLSQSVYVIEDSLRASLFNLGFGHYWYTRKPGMEFRELQPWSYGVGMYFSELNRLADSQVMSVGVAGFANLTIEDVIQIGFGMGPIYEYRFKSFNNRDKGSKVLMGLVLQLRLP